MSYKNSRRDQASFRGVPFYLENSSSKSGRRYQNHEYPKRDKNYAEDLGLATQLKNLSAFVVGDDYDEQRDKLLAALEQEGHGQLVHPWMGTFTVIVAEAEVIETRNEAGIARFTITFIPYYPQEFPAATANTSQLLIMARSALASSVLGSFINVIDTISAGLVNGRAFVQGINSAFNAAQTIMDEVISEIGNVADFAETVINTPQKIIDTFDAYMNSASNVFDRFSNRGHSYNSSLTAIGSYVAQAATLYDKSVLAGSETELAVNAVNHLIEQIIILNIGDEVAALPIAPATPDFNSNPDIIQQVVNPVERPDVPVAEDVIDIRNQVLDLIWTVAARSTPTEYLTLNVYRQKITEHLNVVAASGVHLEEVDPLVATSSLILAYKRFGDATRHKEIEQRNKIIHRNFIYPAPLQIARVTNNG